MKENGIIITCLVVTQHPILPDRESESVAERISYIFFIRFAKKIHNNNNKSRMMIKMTRLMVKT